MYKRITNRISRVERLARLIDDIMGEAQNEPENTSDDKIDRAIRINALDDLDRIANSLETIAKDCDRRGYYS